MGDSMQDIVQAFKPLLTKHKSDRILPLLENIFSSTAKALDANEQNQEEAE